MLLWVRTITAVGIAWDEAAEVVSVEEWSQRVHRPGVVSSVLWPTPPLFPIGGPFPRRHPHETGYHHRPEVNRSYLEAAERLAGRIARATSGRRTLVYAPLRGAIPIWRAVGQFLDLNRFDVHFPVTSSFVRHSPDFGLRDRSGRAASGRYNNVLELQRIRPLLPAYGCLLYLDEIIFGGMMRGHVKEMNALHLERELPIVVAELADALGRRSEANRAALSAKAAQGLVEAFLWEGCDCLITEHQKLLLGINTPGEAPNRRDEGQCGRAHESGDSNLGGTNALQHPS